MPIVFVSLCAQRTALFQLPSWHHCGGVWGQNREVLQRALPSVSWVLPVLAYSPPHLAYPGHQHLVCHRFRAVGNDASRWQSALQRNLERPQGGEASNGPICLSVRGSPGPFATNVAAGSRPSTPASSRLVGSGPGYFAAFCSVLQWGEGQLFFLSSSGWQRGLQALPCKTPLLPSSSLKRVFRS